MKQNLLALLMFVVLVAAFCVAGESDYRDAVRAHQVVYVVSR